MLDILKPCFEKRKRTQASEPDEVYLSNSFEALEVEDIDDVDLDIMATDDLATASRPKTNTIKEAFEVEVCLFCLLINYSRDRNISERQERPNANTFSGQRNIEDELPFIIFCFFEDLQNTRGLIKEAWTKVASGEINRIAASLTTNVAIQLVRSTEKRSSHSVHNFSKPIHGVRWSGPCTQELLWTIFLAKGY
jgi:hypothetical protein